MSDLSRRAFLKVVGAAGAAALLPAFSFADIDEDVLGKPTQLGLLRQLIMYDIKRDCYLGRIDALNKKTQKQFHVDFRINPSDEGTMRKHYLEAREAAEVVLLNMMRHHRWSFADMVPLDIPPGYSHPTWAVRNV